MKKEFDKSTIAKHCWNSNKRFNLSRSKIIQRCNWLFRLDIKRLMIYINIVTYHLVNDMASTNFLTLGEGNLRSDACFSMLYRQVSDFYFIQYENSIPFMYLYHCVQSIRQYSGIKRPAVFEPFLIFAFFSMLIFSTLMKDIWCISEIMIFFLVNIIRNLFHVARDKYASLYS